MYLRIAKNSVYSWLSIQTVNGFETQSNAREAYYVGYTDGVCVDGCGAANILVCCSSHSGRYVGLNSLTRSAFIYHMAPSKSLLANMHKY